MVKSPTLVGVVPTFVLDPLVLSLTCRRSGNETVVTVLVQNDIVWPLNSGNSGVISQLLIVLLPATLLKFTAM
jgi:hypothetical protein